MCQLKTTARCYARYALVKEELVAQYKAFEERKYGNCVVLQRCLPKAIPARRVLTIVGCTLAYPCTVHLTDRHARLLCARGSAVRLCWRPRKRRS